MHYNLSAGAKPDATTIDLLFDDTAEPLQQLIAIDTSLSIPPGETEHIEQISMQVPGNDPLALVSVFPHMHELGETLTVAINDSGNQTCAVHVPRWDFHWQQLYNYQAPLIVEPGSTITLRCTYDSTGRKQTTTFGEGTLDEMCVALFFFSPMP
jgi:hypothetical protein